jgi:hypothetical protein
MWSEVLVWYDSSWLDARLTNLEHQCCLANSSRTCQRDHLGHKGELLDLAVDFPFSVFETELSLPPRVEFDEHFADSGRVYLT